MKATALQVAVRDGMLAQASSLPLLDALDALGVRSIELELDRQLNVPAWKKSDGSPRSLATPAEREVARKLLADRGISVCALLLMTDFPSDTSGTLSAPSLQVQWAIDAVTVAGAMGAAAVRIDPLTSLRELPAERVRETLVASLRRILDATAASTVDLAIENHGAIGNEETFLDGIFAAVPDARVGLTLDPGNFFWLGVPLDKLYSLIEKYAPRARHSHIKNIKYPTELANSQRAVGHDYRNACGCIDEGNIDYGRVVTILQDAGYRRPLCIENESLGKFPQPERFALLQRDVTALQGAIDASGANRR